jgi:hypothetical protein
METTEITVGCLYSHILTKEVVMVTHKGVIDSKLLYPSEERWVEYLKEKQEGNQGKREFIKPLRIFSIMYRLI